MIKKYTLASLSINLTILSSILLIIGLFKVGLLPINKTIYIAIILLIIIFLSIVSYLSKNKNIYNLGIFLTFIINIILIYNIVNINSKYNYITNIFNNEYKYVTYNIYVQKRTPIYSKIEKLDGQKIGMLNKNEENVKQYLNNIISIDYISYETPEEIAKAIDNGEIQCFILTDNDYDSIDEEKTNIKHRVRKIYSNKIKDTL